MSGYTRVDNDIFDAGLSYRAVGLLVTMLSKPPGWKFSSERLTEGEGTEGRDAVRTAMNELIKAGFLACKKYRIDNRMVTQYTLRASKRTPMSEPYRAWNSGAGKPGPLVIPIGITPIGIPKTKTDEVIQHRPAAGKETDVNFGAESETSDTPVVRKPKPTEHTWGQDTDSQPRPKNTAAKSTQVIEHMEALWPQVCNEQNYHNSKLLDKVAFRSYLQTTFFGPEASTPMSVEQVKAMVSQLMADLRMGKFRLKEGQAVWLTFTRRWQNYAKPVIPEDDILRALRAQEFRVDRTAGAS